MNAEIQLWGRTIAALIQPDNRGPVSFEYHPDFIGSNIQVAPLMMPLKKELFSFPDLTRTSFKGLPGLVTDSLPDKFGNQVIDQWLRNSGRPAGSFTAIERLCYTGTRGMGALEFLPAVGPNPTQGQSLDISHLVTLANTVISERDHFDTQLTPEGLEDILLVGTSAGGARAKAVIAWNPDTNEVRSGQVATEEGFQHWLLKFDGVTGNRDKELADPQGYGCIEYGYHLMARAAGITMSDCHLMEEGGRHHFMTRRFDRLPDGQKLHMQTLGAMAHLDFNDAGAHSYEQALFVMRQLDLPTADREELVRRAIFNIVARNQDDHVKNIAFLMDKKGQWSLSPGYDIVYSYNPSGAWTGQHQMSVNGKRDHFTFPDLKTFEQSAILKRGRVKTILAEVLDTVQQWPQFAEQAHVDEKKTSQIQGAFRSNILPK